MQPGGLYERPAPTTRAASAAVTRANGTQVSFDDLQIMLVTITRPFYTLCPTGVSIAGSLFGIFGFVLASVDGILAKIAKDGKLAKTTVNQVPVFF
jgi:hypothetical protein